MQHHDATTTQRIGLERFQHDQLDHSKECIRLLRFVNRPPSSEHDQLETHDIATAPPFVALSYMWGYGRPTDEVIVNNSSLLVRKNLGMALKALCSFFRNDVVVPDKSRPCEGEGVTLPKTLLQKNGYPLMWIDDICINQYHIPKKNHQVNMMGRIFTEAGCMISWLGEEADNSQCVMKAIRPSTHTRYCSVEVTISLRKMPPFRCNNLWQPLATENVATIEIGFMHFWH